MRKARENSVKYAGTITQVNIFQDNTKTNEHFGLINIVFDCGYFDKQANNGQGQWVEKPLFMTVKLDNRCINQVKNNLNVGDDIALSGSLQPHVRKDKNTGVETITVAIRADNITSHTTKAELELLKQHRQSQQAGGIDQHQPQHTGGFQQQAPHNAGGFQQPAHSHGGFQGNQQQGGFQAPHGGQQQ